MTEELSDKLFDWIDVADGEIKTDELIYLMELAVDIRKRDNGAWKTWLK